MKSRHVLDTIVKTLSKVYSFFSFLIFFVCFCVSLDVFFLLFLDFLWIVFFFILFLDV